MIIFLTQQLLIEVDIIDCFKLGTGKSKPIVITVGSIAQRALIFQAMDSLRKQLKDEDKELSIFINDYLPPEIKERRRRERRIYWDNEKDGVNKIPMQIGKSGLEVQGQKYEPMIKEPEPTDVLNYSEEQLDEVYKMDLKAGQKFEDQGSSFIAYVLPANSHIMITKAYLKLRLIHPKAKHILLGYTIPGMPRYSHEEFCDDKEIGGGQFVLNIIKKHKFASVAIFVVRYQRGGKIGSLRYELMEKAVVSVIKLHPYNKFTNDKLELIEEHNQTQFEHGRRGGNSLRRARGFKPQQARGSTLHRRTLRASHGNSDRYKRRRQESPTRPNQVSMGDFEEHFQFTPPVPVATEWGGEGRKDEQWSLGSSWPTLQQSAEK